MFEKNKNIKFEFDTEKNRYLLRIEDKNFDLSREDAVLLHNILNRVLKATPQLFNIKEHK